MKPVALLSLIALLVISCNSEFTPKRRGYYRIDFPKHEYQVFDQPGYPYSFEYPVYATVVKDSTFFEANPEKPYWNNIEIPRFNGKVYISYKDVKGSDFMKLVNDAYKMTYKHSSKATEITDSAMRTPNGVHGMFFQVGGNAATAKQFFLSDTTKHFLRGALYFDATPNEDSLSVVNDFLQEDLKHLINTLKWK